MAGTRFQLKIYATYQGQILGKPTRVWHIFIENDSQRVLFLERVNNILALGCGELVRIAHTVSSSLDFYSSPLLFSLGFTTVTTPRLD